MRRSQPCEEERELLAGSVHRELKAGGDPLAEPLEFGLPPPLKPGLKASCFSHLVADYLPRVPSFPLLSDDLDLDSSVQCLTWGKLSTKFPLTD